MIAAQESIIVTTHTLDQIAARSGQTVDRPFVSSLVADPRRRLWMVESGAFHYAGPGFVLVVRRRRGMSIVVTALSPEMVAADLVEREARRPCRGRAWRDDVARAVDDVRRLRLLTAIEIAATPSAQQEPSCPVESEAAPESDVAEGTTEVESRVGLSLASCLFCRETRVRLGMSQQDLADRVGVLRATIKRIECAQLKSLPATVAARLHDALVNIELKAA